MYLFSKLAHQTITGPLLDRRPQLNSRQVQTRAEEEGAGEIRAHVGPKRAVLKTLNQPLPQDFVRRLCPYSSGEITQVDSSARERGAKVSVNKARAGTPSL